MHKKIKDKYLRKSNIKIEERKFAKILGPIEIHKNFVNGLLASNQY